MDIHVPDDLGPLLCDFTVAVLEENPRSVLKFASEYFPREYEKRGDKKCTQKASNEVILCLLLPQDR